MHKRHLLPSFHLHGYIIKMYMFRNLY